MPNRTSKSGSELFIVDNSDVDWKVLRYLHDWCQISKASRANRLMAARMGFNAVVKKDLYVLKPADSNAPLDLRFVVGLLNSSLLSYVYLTRSAAAQKDDFRQVSLAGLRDLPYPKNLSRSDEICELVETLERADLAEKERTKFDDLLDEIVFDLFGIDTPSRDEVHAFISARG
jgi:hypothetical protein